MILATSLAVSAVPAAAQEGGRWFSPEVGKLKFQLDYDQLYSFEEGVEGQDADVEMSRHGFNVFAPIWQDEVQEFAAKANVGVWDIDSEAWLSGLGARLPDHLWDLSFGGAWRRKLENDWVVGADVEVGSPSDEPFDSEDEVEVTAFGTLRIPAGERDAWMFFLQYSNNRSFLQHIPIPGVAYQWVPDPKRLRTVIGVPFSGIWAEPVDRLEIEARYMLLRRIHAEVGYRVLEPVKVYAGFDWDNYRFFRAGRPDDDDRLFYYEKRLTTGVRWEIAEGLSIDGFGGYAFDQMFFEGEDYDDRSRGRISIDDGFFAGVRAVWRF
jgi:hypothetical protein